MTKDQIKHMVERFLSWKLPENFNPDNGIMFQKTINSDTKFAHTYYPSGTNLLDFTQAEAMVLHMVDGMTEIDREDSRDRLLISIAGALDFVIRSLPAGQTRVGEQTSHNLNECVKDLLADSGLQHARPSGWKDMING